MLEESSLFQISYGIYIITAAHNGEKGGCLVNTVTQLTAQPPRAGVSVSKENDTHRLLMKGGAIGVTVMGEQADSKLLAKFGYRSSRDIDKFADTPHHAGPLGTPLIDEGDLCHLEGKIEQTVDIGTHTLFIFRVEEGGSTHKGIPMTYTYYREVKKGKAGKYAPTYQAPAAAQEKA